MRETGGLDLLKQLGLSLSALVMVLICCADVRAAELPPVSLWAEGAPGSQGKPVLEHVRVTEQGEHIVSGVHAPSVTPFLPDADKATGVAVIVVPGGGHRELWMDHEGYRIGRWLSDHGIAAFVLKYRLAREGGSTYTVEGDELADLRRAIRLVRLHGSEWRISPDRVGVMGFSAGGELAALAGTSPEGPATGSEDPIDQQRSRPNFMALIYPAIPGNMALTKGTPPAFLLCGASDGEANSLGLADLYLALRRAGVSAELHIIGNVGHGFGLRDSNPPAVRNWPDLFFAWLAGQGLLGRP